MGEQNRQNRQNKQNRTAYKSGGTRVRARRRRFKERSDRATPPGARAATIIYIYAIFNVAMECGDRPAHEHEGQLSIDSVINYTRT